MGFEEHRTIELASGKLHVAETRSGGPPMVFLQGNPDSHDVWSAVVERLKDRNRCIAPDLPGYGKSAEQADVTLEAQAALVRGLLDALKLEKVHLIIHDVGGTYGLAFASLHPDRLSALTIFNTTFFPDYRWHFWGRVWRTPVLGEVAMALGNKSLFVNQVLGAAPKLPRAYAERAYESYGKGTRRQVLRFYRYLDPSRFAGWDQRLLKAIAKVPHQVIWGDRDPYLPAHTADRFGGEVVHLPENSHWVMAEDPELAARQIRKLDDRINAR